MRHIALLSDDQEFRWCPLYSFGPLWLPQRGPRALDIFDTTRSFTHLSNTCEIGRLAFLNLGFIDLMFCTHSLPPCTTSHQRILVCPRTSKSWDCSERSWGFPNDCAAVRRLGNWGCSKKTMKNDLVNRSSDKQSESVITLLVRTSID